jgi:hypothetical protein
MPGKEYVHLMGSRILSAKTTSMPQILTPLSTRDEGKGAETRGDVRRPCQKPPISCISKSEALICHPPTATTRKGSAMTNEQPQSFMDKFGPQSSGSMPGGAPSQQPSGYQGAQQSSPYASQYGQQPSYQQPSYQQPSYQQPVYQQYYVPSIPDSARVNRTRSNICFMLMFLLIGAFFALAQTRNPQLASVAGLLGIGAALMWIAAWCFSVKSKGYSGFWGLISIFGLIGMIVLVVLPNKYKRR